MTTPGNCHPAHIRIVMKLPGEEHENADPCSPQKPELFEIIEALYPGGRELEQSQSQSQVISRHSKAVCLEWRPW